MKNTGLAKQAGFALAGVAAAWRGELSFRIQVRCAIVLLAALIVLRPPWIWTALCVVMAVLVLTMELLNTAIESLADRLHPEIHPAIKIAKDCAAGAVLLASAGALVVGVLTVMISIGAIS